MPQATNIDTTNKNINTTDGHSNNTGKNHINDVTNQANIITGYSKNYKNNKKKSNDSTPKLKKKENVKNEKIDSNIY